VTIDRLPLSLLSLLPLVGCSASRGGAVSGDGDRDRRFGDAATDAAGLADGRAPADAPTPDTERARDDAAVGGVIDGAGDPRDRDGTAPPAGEGGPTAGMIPMFVAQGSVERTTISCDDGMTWVGNQSADDSLRCYSNNNLPDCDHGETAGRGLAYGGGWFFASFGWGAGGPLKRSRDGVVWETALTPNQQGTIAFGNGRLFGSDHYTDDLGVTWHNTPGAAAGVTRNVGFIPQAGGHFVLVGDNGTFVSDGSGFTRVTTGCGAAFTLGSGAVASASTTILVNSDGVACRTTDGGTTWKSTSVGGAILSHPIWDGSAFRVWGRGKMYRSADGAAWTATNTTPSTLQIESVAYSPDTGTFVAVRDEWLEWYAAQIFYRSLDGIIWTAIPKANFVGSHRIVDIEFGYGAPSAACPAR
jgi:hypothetical protein